MHQVSDIKGKSKVISTTNNNTFNTVSNISVNDKPLNIFKLETTALRIHKNLYTKFGLKYYYHYKQDTKT